MKYSARIEIQHLASGDPLSESARSALAAAIVDRFRSDNPGVTLSDVLLSSHPRNVVVVHATMRGRNIEDLTSPLAAITSLDEAVRRGLFATGLYEEFDVARRRLRVGPDQNP